MSLVFIIGYFPERALVSEQTSLWQENSAWEGGNGPNLWIGASVYCPDNELEIALYHTVQGTTSPVLMLIFERWSDLFVP